MEKKLYRSLYLALLALMLMLFTGAYYVEKEQPLARILLTSFGGYDIYFGATLPEDTHMTHYTRETLLKGNLLYISPQAPLPKDMPVQQVRNVRKMVGLYVPAAQDVSLSEETIYALCDLCAENPLIRTWITSGVRAPSEQYALQNETFEAYRKTMSAGEALLSARRDVPNSGESEHQLATSFDLQFTGTLNWAEIDALDRSADGVWLRENAWRFGFIRRYPTEKAEITGVINETLHFRYVGREHALVMQATGWCFEEYLKQLKEYGALTIEREERREYIVLCEMTESGAHFDVPQGYTCTVSADNLGHAIAVMRPI